MGCYVLPAQSIAASSMDINKIFNVQQLKSDLARLKDSLQIVHPALYRYTSKKTFDSLFQAADKQVNMPMKLHEFYGIIAPLMARVGDIHTSIELPDEYHSYVAANSQLFPFDVRIINKEVFVVSNNSTDSSIRVGCRIIRINDEPIARVLGKMGSYFSSEGTNETFKLKRVEQRFAFHYHFVYGDQQQFKITYAGQWASKLQTKTIAAQPFAVIRVNRTRNQLSFPRLKPLFAQPPYLTLAVKPEEQTAILTIKWFQNDVLASAGEAFKPFIDSAFASIRKANIRRLVIDIRNNGGGESENASYVYAHLTDRPFRFLYAMETNQKTYEVDTQKGISYTFNKATGKYRTVSGAAGKPSFFGLNSQQPQPNAFMGDLYVLVDGLTVSAAPQLAALVKLHKRGRIVGEEAPGALHGGSGRGYAYFYLPHTGLLAMIAQYRLYLTDPAQRHTDKCIEPDHKTSVSSSDILNGRDKDMEWVLQQAIGLPPYHL